MDAKTIAMLGILAAINTRAAAAGRGHGRHRDGVLPADPGRAGLRSGLRLPARLDLAVRVRAADRRRRPVAAVPDAGRVLGRAGRGSAAAAVAAGGAEIALLAAYGVVAAYFYGTIMNLWFWPFATGDGTGLSYVAGASIATNLHRFALFDVATSLGLGHRAGDHQRRRDHGARDGRAVDPAAGCAQGGLRRARGVRAGAGAGVRLKGRWRRAPARPASGGPGAPAPRGAARGRSSRCASRRHAPRTAPRGRSRRRPWTIASSPVSSTRTDVPPSTGRSRNSTWVNRLGSTIVPKTSQREREGGHRLDRPDHPVAHLTSRPGEPDRAADPEVDLGRVAEPLRHLARVGERRPDLLDAHGYDNFASHAVEHDDLPGSDPSPARAPPRVGILGRPAVPLSPKNRRICPPARAHVKSRFLADANRSVVVARPRPAGPVPSQTARTSSCRGPLVASALPPQGPSRPSREVNRPPASVTTGTSAAMSCSLRSGSQAMSTAPSATSMYDQKSP